MGNRANFGVRQGEDVVFLYGHTAGYNMMRTLANGLKTVQEFGRLSDESYATRILFSQIIGESWSGELGWGISVNYLTDNQHKIPVVDFREGIVSLISTDLTTIIYSQSIESFINRYAKVSG